LLSFCPRVCAVTFRGRWIWEFLGPNVILQRSLWPTSSCMASLFFKVSFWDFS
jgi:hypothetical protein